MKLKKIKIMYTIFSILGGLAIAGFGAFMYLFYAPSPKKPKLSGDAKTITIKAGDYERSYLSYVPKSLDKNEKPGLIIVLHGAGIDGNKIRQWTGYQFDQMADENGFVVLYPDGYKNNWNELRKNGPYPAKKNHIDDVGFIDTLVRTAEKTYGIDPSKVFAFGYSNGGEMAYKIAIEEPNLFSAITAISASLPAPDNFSGSIGEISSRIMMVNGTKDPKIPYKGGKIFFFGQNFGSVISAQETAETFARYSHAVSDNKITSLPHIDENDASSVNKQVWTKGDRQAVVLYTVNNGGHVIPQQIAKMPRFMGKITGDLNAPKEAVKFFGLIKK